MHCSCRCGTRKSPSIRTSVVSTGDVCRSTQAFSGGRCAFESLTHGLGKRDRLQARFHRAYAYDRSGRRRMARERYRLFQQRHPKHPYAKQAKARFEALKRR